MSGEAHLTGAPLSAAPNGAGGQRVCCFDWLRLFAMSCVILMHAASGLLRKELSPGWHGANLLVSLCFTAVPLFFMISGSLLLSSPRSADLKHLWRRRIPRLVLPLLFWSAASLLLVWRWDASPLGEILKSFLAIPSTPAYTHLWYMYTLIAIYVLSPLLYAMVRGMDRAAERYLLGGIAAILGLEMLRMLLPGTVQGYLELDLFTALRFLNGHLFPFLLGFFLFRREKKIQNWKLIVLALFFLGVITVETWLKTRQFGEYSAAFLQQNGGWEICLAALLFLLAKQNLHRAPRLRLTRELVRLSLPIYLVHPLVIKGIWRLKLWPRRFLHLLPVFLLILAISWLISKTLASVPGLCWVSTGIPWAEARESCSWQASFRRLFRRSDQDPGKADKER